jgi:hypothetical protein
MNIEAMPDLLVVRVLSRETVNTLRLCAYMAESNIDTLPPSMQLALVQVLELLRTLQVSDVIVRSESVR